MIASNNVVYFSDLATYALSVISSKCKNVQSSYTSPSWPPDNNEFKNGNEYVYAEDSSQVGDKQSKMLVTPRVQIPLVIQLGTITDSGMSTVGGQLRSYLTSKGVLSKANSIMTTKCILNFFSVFSAFLSIKLSVLKTSDNSHSYIVFNPSTSTSTISITNIDDGNISTPFSLANEHHSITDVLACISSKSNINTNVLNVRYSSSSSSSSSSSCSCSCSSSSSSFIVYMLI